MKLNLFCLLILLVTSGCVSVDKTEKESIGSVKMKEDGTLCFMLRAEGENGELGDAYYEVKKEDKEYQSHLEHVSPINPGEEKLVKPWGK